jgi:hypothetical protein
MTVDSSATYNQSFVAAFFELACTEEISAARVLRQLYPSGPVCSGCGAGIAGRRSVASFYRGDRTYCAACDSKFSPRAGTILADSKLSYSQYEIICLCLSLGVDHKRIATLASVHEDTVAIWHSKIKFWESHV